MKTNPNDCVQVLTTNDYTAVAQDKGNGFHGLTKREYFAAMALQGLLSSSVGGQLTESDWKYFSKHSVEFANYLIEELNKE